jgi:hypothetical protein
MEYVRTGTRIYSNSPWTYARCQEKYAGVQFVVGGFSAAGLSVYYSTYGIQCTGVGGLRKFY